MSSSEQASCKANFEMRAERESRDRLSAAAIFVPMEFKVALTI